MMAPSRMPFRLRIAQPTEVIRYEWNNRDDETFRLRIEVSYNFSFYHPVI